MPKVVSVPQKNGDDSFGYERDAWFGYYETINKRREQQDALSWQTLTAQDLTPQEAHVELEPKEIGHRLWTSYQLMDQTAFRGGTTASTTVYDGKGNLITATLADAAAFAAVYDKNGAVLGVVRLNSKTHKPTDSSEARRIRRAGGSVSDERVDGVLAVSRAIGDRFLKKSGVCSEASIDITNVRKIAAKLQINPKDIGKIQIISTCDGFTDGSRDQTKEGHEKYLLNVLQKMDSPSTKTEEQLAKELVGAAIKSGSNDNISVAIQTISKLLVIEGVEPGHKPTLVHEVIKKTPPFLLGVYDGHGYDDAAIYVACNIVDVFIQQCNLSPEAYAQQELSVNKNEAVYKRDNTDPEEEFKKIVDELLLLTQTYQNSLNLQKKESIRIKLILDELIIILQKPDDMYEDRIQEFYIHLNQQAKPLQSEKKQESFPSKNIDLIKKDTSTFAINYVKGTALIFAIVCSFVVPGLLLSLVVYGATGRHPLDLFKNNSERYEKDLDLITQNHKLNVSFFKPEYSSHQENGDMTQDSSPGVEF